MIRIKAQIADPLSVAKDWRLSGESVRVFALLYDHRGTEFVSMDDLRTTLGISQSTFYRALSGLRKYGYVEEKRVREGRVIVLRGLG